VFFVIPKQTLTWCDMSSQWKFWSIVIYHAQSNFRCDMHDVVAKESLNAIQFIWESVMCYKEFVFDVMWNDNSTITFALFYISFITFINCWIAGTQSYPFIGSDPFRIISPNTKRMKGKIQACLRCNKYCLIEQVDYL